jgi:hypothetical protein
MRNLKELENEMKGWLEKSNKCNFAKKLTSMTQEAVKLELITWMAKLTNQETINYLKIIKDESSKGGDWWDDLTNAQKAGIDRGLKDLDEGRITPHETIKNRYGL